MPLSINTNIASMTAQRSFLVSNQALETSFERLATGKRVNSAVDDAAGLAIGTDLQSRVGGLNQSIRNVNDGISMVQIAEGTYDEVTTILQRMRDLAVQAANGALHATELSYLDAEHSKLATALGQAIDQAKFNGTDIVSDTAQTTKTIQAGADTADTVALTFKALTETLLGVDATQIDLTGTSQVKESVAMTGLAVSDTAGVHTMTVNGVAYNTADETITQTGNGLAAALRLATADDGTIFGDLYTITVDAASGAATGIGLTIERKVNGDDPATTYTLSFAASSGTDGQFNAGTSGSATPTDGTSTATDAITAIDTALDKVNKERATLGATQAQLESMVRNLANVAENTAAATGRVMDTDYAAETANLTKAQILQQAATSILAQANAQPQAVLSLLQ